MKTNFLHHPHRLLMAAALLGMTAPAAHAQEPEKAKAAGATRIDLPSFVLPCGRREYRRTNSEGRISKKSTEFLGRGIRNGYPVYIVQEYDESNRPNDQGFIHADMRKQMEEIGGVDDYRQPSETRFFWDPPLPALMRSFIPGKTYSGSFARPDFKNKITGTTRTVAEKVKVPAGTFQTWKVTRTAQAGSDKFIEHAWYAPGLGLVKRYQEGGSLWELTSYQPAPWLVMEQPAGREIYDGVTKRALGTAKIGQKGRTMTFRIRNRGTAPLSGLAIRKSGTGRGDFKVTALGRTTLKPGDSTSFKVRFAPRKSGTRKATLKVSAKAPANQPFAVKLRGVAVK